MNNNDAPSMLRASWAAANPDAAAFASLAVWAPEGGEAARSASTADSAGPTIAISPVKQFVRD